jgi:hypothetical protein
MGTDDRDDVILVWTGQGRKFRRIPRHAPPTRVQRARASGRLDWWFLWFLVFVGILLSVAFLVLEKLGVV